MCKPPRVYAGYLRMPISLFFSTQISSRGSTGDLFLSFSLPTSNVQRWRRGPFFSVVLRASSYSRCFYTSTRTTHETILLLILLLLQLLLLYRNKHYDSDDSDDDDDSDDNDDNDDEAFFFFFFSFFLEFFFFSFFSFFTLFFDLPSSFLSSSY